MNEKSLHKVLAQPRQAGIYRLPQNCRTALRKAAEALGFKCFSVNFDESGDIDTALLALGRDLDFPDWYGRNLDALNDCLTDLAWHSAPGYVIAIAGANALRANTEAFCTLNEVFTSAVAAWQAQDVALWVVYEFANAERADGLAPLPTRP